MAKAELGTKRQCQSCGAKFYDLSKSPILCPKCNTVFVAPKASSVPVKPEPEEEDEAVAAERGVVAAVGCQPRSARGAETAWVAAVATLRARARRPQLERGAEDYRRLADEVLRVYCAANDSRELVAA